MFDYTLANECVQAIKDDAKKLATYSERLNVSDASQQQTVTNIQRAYVHAMDAALDIQRLSTIVIGAERTEQVLRLGNDDTSGVKIEAFFDAGLECLSCRFFSPPILKSVTAARRYFELVCLDLEREIVKKIPQNFVRFRSAYVIYINYFNSKTPPTKQPYFDNDNIAIKGILDAVVPYVCYDDASKFCDNIYLSNPGETDYTELHIVPKGRLFRWLQAHRTLLLSNELLEN